jgi:hypothetical protein
MVYIHAKIFISTQTQQYIKLGNFAGSKFLNFLQHSTHGRYTLENIPLPQGDRIISRYHLVKKKMKRGREKVGKCKRERKKGEKRQGNEKMEIKKVK